jgi:AraC-like DNA-binding protein
MTLGWTDLIALFTLFQLVLLAVVNFNNKKGKQLSNRLLAVFMIANALLISQFLLTRFQYISQHKYILLFVSGDASYLLLMPLLYLYVRSLCYQDFRLKTVHLLHATPFILIVILSMLISLKNGHETGIAAFLPMQRYLVLIKFWSHKIILHVQILSYLVAAIAVLTDYRRGLKDLYSSLEKIDLAWCNLLLVGFSAMWLMDLLAWILRTYQAAPDIVLHGMFIISLLINLTFTLAVTYKGLAQSESFSGIQALPKYAASRLKPADCEEITQKLAAFMKKEKPYLTPSLSMEDLTKKLNLPAKQLSQAVHTCLNQNFYDLINTYRIEEAKERIRDYRFRNLTLLSIAYDVGYNSKSVFNAAFKKQTGMTPKEYKIKYSSLPDRNGNQGMITT